MSKTFRERELSEAISCWEKEGGQELRRILELIGYKRIISQADSPLDTDPDNIKRITFNMDDGSRIVVVIREIKNQHEPVFFNVIIDEEGHKVINRYGFRTMNCKMEGIPIEHECRKVLYGDGEFIEVHYHFNGIELSKDYVDEADHRIGLNCFIQSRKVPRGYINRTLEDRFRYLKQEEVSLFEVDSDDMLCPRAMFRIKLADWNKKSGLVKTIYSNSDGLMAGTP